MWNCEKFLGVRIGVDYANGLEIEAAVNKTEEVIKANKVAMIESIFDVKRQALRALSSIKQQYTAALNAFINASINNLNQALVATQNGITLSKTFVADLASQVTIDNIQGSITDAQDSINDVISKYSTDVYVKMLATVTVLKNVKNIANTCLFDQIWQHSCSYFTQFQMNP